MPIKANAGIEAMADRLAALRGQSIEDVVAAALRAELAREPAARSLAALSDDHNLRRYHIRVQTQSDPVGDYDGKRDG
jgi:hypothetical protein